MMKGLVVLLFVMMITIIVFLSFQINDNANRCRQNLSSNQDRLTQASRLLLQSATQQHDLFAHEHAQEAKYIIDDIIQQHGGVNLVERDLKLPKGRLEHLKSQIYEQFNAKQALIMDKIMAVHPELNVPENEDAGLKRRRRKSRKH